MPAKALVKNTVQYNAKSHVTKVVFSVTIKDSISIFSIT